MDTVNRQVNKQTTVKPNNDKAEASYLPNSIKQKLVLSNETLNKLINLFQSGDLAACKSMALTLTSQHPKHGFAWKILGTIYQNESQNEAARDALLTAVKLMPKDADIHYNLANAYFDLEQKKLAIKHYLKSIKIKPDFLKAHYNLGSIYFSVENYALSEKHLNTVIKLDPSHYEAYLQLTKVYDAQQNYTAAIELLKSVIALQPNFFDAYLSLAIEFQNANLKNEAIVTYEQLLSLAPERIDAYNSLGLYLLKLKKYVQAERTLLKALGIDDASPEILNSLSFVYSAQKNTEEATYYLQKSMVKNPNNVLAYINYGLLLLKRGDASSASAYFLKALEIEPENVISMNNLGLAFISIASFDNAVEQFEAVLAIEPKYVPALTNISVPLKRLGRLTEAEDYLKRALSINPKSHDTNVNLASIYQGRTDIKQSVEYNLKAIEINPKLTMAYSNMLFSMCYSNDFSKSYVNEQLEKYGDIVTKNANFEYISWLPKAHSSKLKIGFVSADFILHPVTSFLSTVLENIDSNKFELYAYTNLVKQDEITQQIKPFFKEWKTIVGVEDEDAATLIHEDGLDILIDLSGHSAGNRLPVFAYKPAPVQATWLGYWASTGVNQIDYIILDETSAPKEIADQFTEQVHYIPDSRFCYSPPNESIEISALPALKNGYVTIGCYHNYAKVTDTVLALWAEVLKQSPTTVLRWQTTAFADENMINTIHSKFSNLHIDASRIELLPSTSRQDYLLSYNDIDFVLDCFPFTACTTTSDALWMGVPTLTIAGDSLVSRQGTSLMNAVGLPNWIAKDSAQYVEKALDFLSDVNSLSKCRQNLRAQLLNSTLGDAKKFTQNIEHALTAMHQAYLSKAPVVNVEQPIQQASKVAVNIVSATRYSEGEFWAKSPLAKSVKSIIDNDPMVSLNVAFDNTSALPTLFNEQINKADDDAIIIFIHDDVIINQSDLTSVVAEGLENFDVIGVVGNKRQVPKQPAWAFIDDDFNWDDFENLSGRIYAGDETKHKENYFGPSGAKCKLIDGVFIA
jgi:predicted O-linked N-acetylglucosamine transferase (SPINDLY family)